MEKSKKITNQDIMNSMNEQFKQVNERIDKEFKQVNERINKIDAKIDLMLKTPTMNKEIDYDALNKLK